MAAEKNTGNEILVKDGRPLLCNKKRLIKAKRSRSSYMHNLLTLIALLPFAQFALSAWLLAFCSLVARVFCYCVQSKGTATHTLRTH